MLIDRPHHPSVRSLRLEIRRVAECRQAPRMLQDRKSETQSPKEAAMNTIVKGIVGIVAGAGILMSSSAALAQSDYPNRPIKLIVGFAPGGSTDIVARIVAQRLGERLGQTDRGREQGGRGRNDRSRRYGEVTGRRVHADSRNDQHACDCARACIRSYRTTRSPTSRRSRWWRSRPTCWWSIRRCRRAT